MFSMEYLTLKQQFVKKMADHITISVEDLNATELAIMDKAFDIIQDSLEECKTQADEVKRLSLELANIKSMRDDTDYDQWDEEED
mgnify:CR=1 FL=1